MTTEELVKKADEEDKDEEESKENKDKSFGIEDSINALTETIKGFDSELRNKIDEIGKKVDGFDARVKALEEPTDLPLKPKVQAEDDIGAKTKVPDTYQSNSQQAGIKEADPENSREGDKAGLSMQEKAVEPLTKNEQVFTTQTPRPGAAVDTIEKSTGIAPSPILQECRKAGFEGLNMVAKSILRGDFGVPQESVPQW